MYVQRDNLKFQRKQSFKMKINLSTPWGRWHLGEAFRVDPMGKLAVNVLKQHRIKILETLQVEIFRHALQITDSVLKISVWSPYIN